jgi:hypothetical protein
LGESLRLVTSMPGVANPLLPDESPSPTSFIPDLRLAALLEGVADPPGESTGLVLSTSILGDVNLLLPCESAAADANSTVADAAATAAAAPVDEV